MRGGLGRAASLESPAGGVAAAKVLFIDSLNASSDSGVGWRRYLSTKAAMPRSARACATSHPSLPIDNHLKPPPGATMTAAPFALPGFGKKGVSVALEILRAMGSPHWRNHVSRAG